jgi:hypothetical protein
VQVVDIAAFQRSHRNHLGVILDDDGVVGPETRWALDVASLSYERRTVIAEGQKYIGLVEYPPGSNDDPKGIIDGWLKHCRAKEGDPWCASAVSCWLSTVLPIRQAGAIKLGQHFPPTDSPWAGDLGWYPTNDKGNGHVFLIIGVGMTEVMTLEGNCNNKCQVVRRPRPGLRFARTFDETLGSCPRVILNGTVPLLVGGGTR